jgi:monoterpene epsilon-lactone hydrolase
MTRSDAREISPIVALRNDHRRAMRLAGLLVERVDRLRRLDAADLWIAHDIFRYMVDFVDSRHHAREDRVIDALLKREPWLSCHVEQIGQAHDELRLEGDTLLRELTAMRERGTLEGRTIVPRLANYAAALSAHFESEERELFERAAAVLTESDWRRIDEPGAAGHDPLFGPQVEQGYEKLFEVYVGRVLEMGAPSRVPGPRAAALLVDGSAALIEGARSTVSALVSGAKRTIRANVAGAGAVVQSRSLSELASAASVWTSGNVGETKRAVRRVRELTRQLTSTLEPVNSAFSGVSPQFVASHRFDRTPPSWQSQIVNLSLRALVKRGVSKVSIESIRQPRSRLEQRIISLDDDVTVARWKIGGGEAEVFEVDGVVPERTVLHLPGGGFVMQATQAHRLMAARLARQSRARVVMMHYRLAPEDPYPAGLDDCVAAYRHLVEGGTDPASIVLSGDSAGAGLALSLLQRCRLEGLPLPAATVAISPVTDLTYSGASRTYNRWIEPMLPDDNRNFITELYLRGVPTDDPVASPLFGDQSNLPPLLIQVGSIEILLDDSLRFAAKVRAQGGECECEVWHEMPHDFLLFGMLPEAKKALGHVVKFIEKHTPTPAWAAAAAAQPLAAPARKVVWRERLRRKRAPAGRRAA